MQGGEAIRRRGNIDRQYSCFRPVILGDAALRNTRLGNKSSVWGADGFGLGPFISLEGDRVISTVMVKDELGLKTFQHIHDAVVRQVDGKLYIIAQTWNPGDVAILEQVMP